MKPALNKKAFERIIQRTTDFVELPADVLENISGGAGDYPPVKNPELTPPKHDDFTNPGKPVGDLPDLTPPKHDDRTIPG